ncbi:MAG TPA: major capsid protein [Jiangellaceae bacterium]
MDEFSERLGRLAELTPEELDALEQEMVAAFDAADAAGDVATMQALADALDQVREAKSNAGGETPAPAEGEAVAASAETPEEPEPEQPEEPETPTPDAPEGVAPVAETPEEPQPGPSGPTGASGPSGQTGPTGASGPTGAEPEAVAPPDPEQPAPPEASEETTVAEVTNADVPDAHRPVPVSAAAPYAITAGGDIPGITAGQQLRDMDEVIDALTRKINGMRGVGGDGEYVIVASMRRDLEAEYGEQRLLRRGDPEGNSEKIRLYAAANQTVESLQAAGWCAPRTPLYDIPGIGTTATPVADSLPSFGVDRGGIIWQEPPSLGDITAKLNAANAFGFWRNVSAASGASGATGQDWQYVAGVAGGNARVEGTNPAYTGAFSGATGVKPCIDIDCGLERASDLMAVPLCLCFDNLMARANPEMVKANTDLVMVAQARFKEMWLLAQIFGAAGVTNTPATIGTPDTALGAARDFLVTCRLACSQFRWRNRIGLDTQLRLYAPAWLRDAMASDLAIQMPGDDMLDVSYSEIDGYIGDMNVSPIWYIDDVPTGVGTGATVAGSNFDSPLGYPTPAEWLVTLPGVFSRLDGGSLDLGVVRTKEDVQRNKYCEFAETFESVAYMGPSGAGEAWAFRGTTPIAIRGGFAPAVTALTNMVAE